ncbi:DUF1351 domain-containing protein [Paratractidigestivibacter sp.]|uniref:DUF1351 domain-containing protein n=1 Tax=Paratractidigestivibacter sp. TaxID=2847316 RepID=UPI002AC9258B|nr:DUF1351 domain-containing protein [Paratractidigestivibacter sp.]
MTSEAENVVAEVIEEQASSLTVAYKPSVIEANFDALEAHVRKTVEAYDGATYDLTKKENIAEAKHDRGYLNGLKKEIDERRKAVKREYSKPLDIFERRCKQVTAIIDEAADNIKAQLDQAEEERKASAYAKLQEHYEGFAGLLAPVVPYERFHEPQWLNKTFGEVKAYKALEAKVSKLAGDWETLKSQFEGEPFYAEAERELFATLDLGSALTAASKASEEAARIAELKAAMEPEPETAPDPEPAGNWYPSGSTMQEIGNEPVCPAPQCAPAPVPAPATVSSGPATPCVMLIDSATTDQMQAIGRFCGSIGVSGVFKRGTLQQVYERTIR